MRISDWSSDVCSSDLAADREDRLDARVPALAGRAAGRVALDDEDLALLGVGRLAVRELAGQTAAAEQTLAGAGQESGRASCRERVCQYVSISVVAVALQKKNETHIVGRPQQHN